jgi:hypothetical protein
MATPVINYSPPPTIREFIRDHSEGELFYDWVIGPVGSGKTTGIFFKLIHMAKMQAPSPDGIRRTRAVIVRNTMPQLRDTTLSSWAYWFKDGQAGEWIARDNKFVLRFNDVECEVLFRPLDTPDDVARVLSLEVTFAIIDEFVEIPREIVDALSARLGRYPSMLYGGATNWGMWGSSNPSTEDNWWFDYLHSNLPDNAHYFVQPSGLNPAAENVENLPGGRGYYTNQMKGKSEAWVKQFIEAEWGFSIAGTPVVPTFKSDLHLTKRSLIVNPHLPIVVGMDPGLGGSAMIFGQQDMAGRLNVFGELVQAGYGAQRLISERLKHYIRRRFPENKLIIAPDPAAANRSQTDEKAVIDEFRRHFEVKIETNNRLPLRLDAIDHFSSRLVEGGAALQIDAKECPVLVRALKGGWRYAMDKKRDIIKGADPEKNAYSHPGDAFGYLCRYFHRQTEREMRYSGTSGARPFVPPRSFGAAYHFK